MNSIGDGVAAVTTITTNCCIIVVLGSSSSRLMNATIIRHSHKIVQEFFRGLVSIVVQ
jgi:hypothetical protein